MQCGNLIEDTRSEIARFVLRIKELWKNTYSPSATRFLLSSAFLSPEVAVSAQGSLLLVAVPKVVRCLGDRRPLASVDPAALLICGRTACRLGVNPFRGRRLRLRLSEEANTLFLSARCPAMESLWEAEMPLLSRELFEKAVRLMVSSIAGSELKDSDVFLYGRSMRRELLQVIVSEPFVTSSSRVVLCKNVYALCKHEFAIKRSKYRYTHASSF